MSARVPEVWFAIPSANPENCRRTLPRWREMGYKVAVLQNLRRGDIPADVVAWSDAYPGWPRSINTLCRDVVPASADIVVSGGDDMLPDPTRPAGEIAREFVARFGGTMGVMQPHGDAFLETHEICGSPWLGREWIERAYGGLGPMPACYHHHWADLELALVAKGYGLLWSRPDLTQRHEHFMRHGAAAPAYWRAAVATDLPDCRTFALRAWLGFPDARPLGVEGGFDRSVVTDAAMLGARQRVEDSLARAARLAELLRRYASAGVERVAIAAHAAQAVEFAAELSRSPVEVAAWIDPLCRRRAVMGVPVVSGAEAVLAGVRGAVIVGGAEDVELWTAARPLVDAGVPLPRLGGLPTDAERRDRFRAAAARLRTGGASRPAVYGGGAHTRAIAQDLSPCGVVAVLDDDPRRAGAPIGGVPVVPPGRAHELGVDAVILSSDAHEDALARAAEPLRAAGLTVHRLYGFAPERARHAEPATA